MLNRSRTMNSWWHRQQIKWQARRDGRAGIPAIDDPRSSETERMILAQGKQILESARGRHAEGIQRIEAKLNAAFDGLRRDLSNLKDSLHKYNTKRHELGRGVTIHIRRFWYVCFLALIAVGELALNYQAFQVFEKPAWLTFLMSLAVAIGLPVSAHFIGIFFKQWPKPHWRTAIYVTVFVGIALLCLTGVNIARSEYLKLMDAELASHEDVLQHAFLMINIFVFATAILLSHFAHDTDQDFENLHNEVARLDHRCGQAVDRIQDFGGMTDTLRARRDAELETGLAVLQELVELYRRHNRLARKDGQPRIFLQDAQMPTLTEFKEHQKVVDPKEIDKLLAEWSLLRQQSLAGPVREAVKQ